MPSYPLRALVLRKTKLGETDLILTLLAKDGCQVRAVAKGARKAKSRIGARAEPFTVLDLLLHTGRSLEVIAEAETLESHDGLRSDLDRTMAATVVANLLDKISVEGQVEPKLFDMALVTLDVMETAAVEQLRVVVLAFLLKALAMHGYRPSLDACACCGRAVSGGGAFSVGSGGLVCDECESADPSAFPASAATCGAMRALMRSRIADVPALDIPVEVAASVFLIVRGYLSYHVPARLRAVDMYAAQFR